ncbi:HEAT repeat domain-containing protein [Planctomycetota bacterium]
MKTGWIVAAVFSLVLVLILVFHRPPSLPLCDSRADRSKTVRESLSRALPRPSDQAIEMELQLAQQHLKQGNVAALVELLDSDYEKTRIHAARYLAQIGDETALPRLEGLARSWDTQTTDNPYAQSLVQIERRLAARKDTPKPEPPSERESDVNEPPHVMRDSNSPTLPSG